MGVPSLRNGARVDLYAFTLEPQLLGDYEMVNYYTSTHPDSRLAQTLTVQLPTPTERTTSINRELTADRGDTVTSRKVKGKAMGIVGMGKGGKAMVQQAKGFKMKILFYQSRSIQQLTGQGELPP